MRQVASAAELLQRLEESAILEPDRLAQARALAAETSSGTLYARRLAARGLITIWQAGQLLRGRNQFRLGKYLLNAQIGQGDFGRIYLARHPQLRRDVAIKTLSRRFTRHPEIVHRFLADAREVAAFDHHNIVHLFDVDCQDNRYFLVMEYVQGHDLQQRVRQRGPESLASTVDLLRQTLAGLAFAHGRGVLHRDLQPANLLLDGAGVLKIIGFGVSRLVGLRVTSGEPAGELDDARSAPYRAPELRGATGACDVRTDLFALGATAQFLLTGRAPAAPGSPSESTAWFPATVATPGRPDADKDAAALVRVVNRLLDNDPARRYASAQAVEQALQEAFPRPTGSVAYRRVSGVAAAASVGPPVAHSAVPAEPAAVGCGTAVSPATPEDGRRVSASAPSRLRPPWVLAVVLLLAAAGGWSVWRSPSAGAIWSLSSELLRWVPQRRLALRQDTTRFPSTSPSELRQVETVASGTEGAGRPTDGTEPPTLPTPSPAGDPAPPNAAPSGGADGTSEVSPPPPAPPRPEAPAASPAAAAPLMHLPPALDLPPPTPTRAAAPVPCDLGVLAIPADAPVAISLLGGLTAGPPGTSFQLAPSRDSAVPRWRFQCVDTSSGDPADAAIAELAHVDQRLLFTWLDAATQLDSAPYLCNCVLHIRCGDLTHDLRLRRPEPCAPLRVNLKKPTTTLRAKISTPPDGAQLRFQVIPVKTPWPEHSALNPAAPVPVSGGTVRIVLGDEAEADILALALTPQCRSAFQLTCEATFRVQANAEAQRCSARKMTEVEQWVAQNQTQANALTQHMRAVVVALAASDPARGAREADLRQAEANLAACTTMTQRMQWLSQTRAQVAQGAPIHFRLFYLADGCEVDLLCSDAAVAP